MKLATVEPDLHSDQWGSVPQDDRLRILMTIEAFKQAPEKGRTKWLKQTAITLGTTNGALKDKFYAWKTTGDWKVLADKRTALALRETTTARTREPRFITWLLTLVESYQRKNAPAFREARRRWKKRDGIIPGYEDWPNWPALPDGWSSRNLADIVKRETNKAAMRSIRVGTSSKTNPFLPHVHTTRVGLWQGAVIQLDDMWHNNLVTVRVGNKPRLARVLELAAVDLFSAHRFHWGCKPRLRRLDGTMENLGGRDARLFLAGLFHRFGRCPRGMSFMVEHATMSIPEEIERILYDYSGGAIRVNRQPIEGKQAALCGHWSGTEGGNFRAKALIESLGNPIQNDLAHLPGQLGSPSSGLLGPVTTERYRAWMERKIDQIEKINPARLAKLRTGTLDFHSEFLPLITDYYDLILGMNTDHAFEGWEELNHFATEYTAVPGSELWIPESALMDRDFDPDSREIILRNAARNPGKWSQRRRLASREVWNMREKWEPVPPALICDILSKDLAREVTARKGNLTFSDKEFAPFPLIYQARFCSGPQRGQEIGHGEKVLMFANPYDDHTAIAVDAKLRFLGELPLVKRVTTINADAFTTDAAFEDRPDLTSPDLIKAAGEKHQRIAEILEPVRIRHADQVQAAKELRADATRLADPRCPVTGEEIALDKQGKRTARQSAAAYDLAEEALANIAPHVEERTDDGIDF